MRMSDQVDPDLTASSRWRHNDSASPQHEHLPDYTVSTTDPIMHEPPGVSANQALGLSPTSARLYNQDLAPTKIAGRRWTAYSIFTLWANDVHSLGNYRLRDRALRAGPWRLADPAGPRCGRRPAVPAPDLFRLYGPQDRCSFPGDEPHRLRHAGRPDSRTVPWRRRHRLVRYPDLPGVPGATGPAYRPGSRPRGSRPQFDPRSLHSWLAYFPLLWIVQASSSSTEWT